MATFIDNLTAIHDHKDYVGLTLDEKFLKMGQFCPLLPHLEGIEVPRSCFIALNVQTAEKRVIPFFSISKDGDIDTTELRKLVVRNVKKSNKEGFFSCPQFIEKYKIEALELKIRVEDRDGKSTFVVQVEYIKCYTTDKDTDELIAEVEDHLNRTSSENFISAWADAFKDDMKHYPFHAVLKVSDPDKNMVGHSFFMILAQAKYAVSYVYDKYSLALMDIISIIKSLYTEDINKLSKKEAIKSAISAIMSRNMSHNLGSHYLYYTKAHLEELAKSQDEIAPDIRGTAKVLGYIQARMDYLATVISNDKYPYGAVNFKSQIYDELTIDKFSKRHFSKPDKKNLRTTNFLLSNLVLSENFSISDIRRDDSTKLSAVEKKTLLELYVKYRDESTGLYDQFTGTNSMSALGWPTFKTEENVKNRLSNLYIALPGGIMSSHAFFNTIENFIRNSAKYLQLDFQDEGLIFNIAIREHSNAEDKSNSYVDLIIYDNKRNANKCQDCQVRYIVDALDSDQRQSRTLYEAILNKLGNIKIINEANNEIEKDSKGFKEILFSSAWMKSYEYNDSSYADVMAKINADADPDTKLSLIEKYGFSLVQVVERKVGSGRNIKFDLNIYDREDYKSMPKDQITEANLGIMITLPKFNKYVDFQTRSSLKSNIESMLNVYSDIVGVDDKFLNNKDISHCFPRIYSGPETDTVTIMKEILNKRFPGFADYRLVFDNCKEFFDENLSEDEKLAKTIFFKRHLNSKENISKYVNYAYADTVSGGNFTVTINDLMSKGLDETGAYKDADSEFFALKVKESALTRITVIDERLFNSMKGKETEYAVKNIRVLNYMDSNSANEIYNEYKDQIGQIGFDIFDLILKGNEFSDKKSGTHFLSIHLGLVEKMLKNCALLNDLIDDYMAQNDIKKTSEDNLAPERVTVFMKLLEKKFGIDGGDTFVSIHSGRGNFSKELEGPLARYPFVSLSALENAFNNSKYLLAQIFYNTVYIGKGMANDTRVK